MLAAELVSIELKLAGLRKVTIDSSSLGWCFVEAEDTIDSSSVATPSFRASASTRAIHMPLATAGVVHKPSAATEAVAAKAAFSIGSVIRKVPTTRRAIPSMVAIDIAASVAEVSCKVVQTQIILLGTWNGRDQNSARGTATVIAGVIVAQVAATVNIAQVAISIITVAWEDVVGIVMTARQLTGIVREVATGTSWATTALVIGIAGGMRRTPACHQQVARSRRLQRGPTDHTMRTVGSIQAPNTHLLWLVSSWRRVDGSTLS